MMRKYLKIPYRFAKSILREITDLRKRMIIFLFEKKCDLIILDDIFPHLLSGFRIAEFNVYLENIEKCKILSSTSAFKWLREYRSFEEVKADYHKLYPLNSDKILKFDGNGIKAKLVYFVFIHNTFEFLYLIDKFKIPFIFTLYPGGGFRLNDEKSDSMLKTVFANPYFNKVIVTTKTTLDYLIDNGFCEAEKIEFIYGVVTQSNIFENTGVIKNKYPLSKATFDICFVAHKYTPQGKDKGYDVFIEVAKRLFLTNKNIFFHIVGSFNESDIDITEIQNNITFYNTLETRRFSDLYKNMDIILSPNSSFILAQGAFDGFPTGSSIEAGLNGVALFVADDLAQNIVFKDREEIVILSKDPGEIVERIEHYYNNPELLYDLAAKGKKKIQESYNLDVQMKPRLEIIKNALLKL